jgi:S-layer homology domain
MFNRWCRCLVAFVRGRKILQQFAILTSPLRFPCVVALWVATVAAPTIAGAVSPPAETPDPPEDRVISVEPSYGPSDTHVTIRANVRLDKATEVVWGGHTSKEFSVQKDGSIITSVPLGGFPGATTVPVTVILNNVMLPTDSQFTMPVGAVDIIGPSPFVPGDPSDYFWFNGGGRTFQLGPSGTVLYGDPKPVFYLSTAFVGSGVAYSPGKPPYAGGNEGRFQAMLFMCDVGNDVAELRKKGFTTACKNWDGYEGVWVSVDDKCAPFVSGSWTSHMLPSWNPQILRWNPKGAASDRIALDMSPCFDKENLARTFQYSVRVEQDEIGPSAAFPARVDTKTSPAFNVVIPPAAMLQTNVIPYTILYQPPGDQSTVSYTATKTYSTQFSIAGSKGIDNKSTTSQTSSVNFAESLAFLLGFGVGATTQDTQTTMKDFGTVQGGGPQGMSSAAFGFTYQLPANPTLVPGSGVICTSTTTVACSATTPTPNLYALEPFWNDIFVLFIHPQFEVWVIGGKADRYMMYGAVPVLGEMSVAQLDACATGATLSWGKIDPCEIHYSDTVLTSDNDQTIVRRGLKEKVKLSATEARHLLDLDPFYAEGQAADVNVSRANLVASPAYGAMAGTVPVPYTAVLTNTDQLQLNQNAQVSYTTNITAMYGSTTSIGQTLSLSAGFGGDNKGGGVSPTVGANESLTIQSQDQVTNETDLKLTYQDSTAVSKQKVTAANVVLSDLATCTGCHGPLASRPSVNIYFDRAFGGFMFQDPYAPKDFSRDKAPRCCIMLVNSLVQLEAANPRFSDIARNDPEIGVIGLLALTGVLPGNADGTFKPHDPFTREQLAVAMTQAAHLPERPLSAKFADVPADRPSASMIAASTAANLVAPRSTNQFGLNDPVTRADLAATLSRAGLTKAAGTSAPNPAGSLTRAEAARAIFQALQNR